MESEMSESDGSIHKVQTLLRAKDDTSRFVGLALLKSVLDNSPDLRHDEDAIVSLWDCIPPKFLERLIRTGSKQKQKDPDAPDTPGNASSDMLDLAVSVLHTFAALLPETARQSPKLIDRIPQLVACLLHCSQDTARLVLETLASLVSQPEGGRVFTTVQDLSPLTEMAPSQPLALDTLLHAWLSAMTVVADKGSLRASIDSTIGSLVASFTGTDAVTLLAFLASLLPRLDPEVLPTNPKWLPSLAKFIRNLVASRPTAAGRAAFTNLSAALLEAYPVQAPQLLFADQGPAESDNPFSYLLVNLLLVDLRATLPTLLAQLNTPDYPATARRLAAAFNVLSHFIGYLLRSIDSAGDGDGDDGGLPRILSPDLLLKLRKAIAETLSLTAEFLRDRWDASVAGAMGLHPDARPAAAGGAHLTLAWDSKTESAADDPLVLAAVRALALWVREDDNDLLRKEAAGLADMFVELYRSGAGRRELDFRRPVLVAFEGIAVEKKGRAAVLDNGGWEALAEDLVAVLEGCCGSASSRTSDEGDAARGVEIVRVLLPIAEAEQPGPREAWMDLVTKVAALYVPPELDVARAPAAVECLVAALQLATALLAGAHPGMRKRYVHSTTAVLGIASQLRGKVRGDRGLRDALEDVVRTLTPLR